MWRRKRSSHEDTNHTKNYYEVHLVVRVSFVLLRVFVVSLRQEGHPLTGTWTGDVGARHVTLALEWDGKNVTGTINPGPNAVADQDRHADAGRWSVHLEADGTGTPGSSSTARVANIGSATRNADGTWTEGASERQVTLTRVDSMSTSSNSGDLPRAIRLRRPRRSRCAARSPTSNGSTRACGSRQRSRSEARARTGRSELADSATTLERNG